MFLFSLSLSHTHTHKQVQSFYVVYIYFFSQMKPFIFSEDHLSKLCNNTYGLTRSTKTSKVQTNKKDTDTLK